MDEVRFECIFGKGVWLYIFFEGGVGLRDQSQILGVLIKWVFIDLGLIFKVVILGTFMIEVSLFEDQATS